MEPITTTWIMSSLLSGWLGNGGDYWLCKAANKLYHHINDNVQVPANQHIQRAVRKSYLKATLMAVDHLQAQRKRYSFTDLSWENLYNIKIYIKEEINLTTRGDGHISRSGLDNKHREILFPKDGYSARERMPELIQNLKESIIIELERRRLRVETALKESIYHGWKEGSREMDFYKLICAFFTQELKSNTQLSTFIQTEYLDTISAEMGDLTIGMSEFSRSINAYFEQYKDILPHLREILSSIEDVKESLSTVPEKTASLIIQGIRDQNITSRQVTVSEEYQIFLEERKELEGSINFINVQIHGVEKALTQVDEKTKDILEQNIKNLETQLLQKSIEKENKDQAFNEFINNVINLAKQLKMSEGVDSSRLEKARVFFEEGKYTELNQVLNEQEIDKDIARYIENGKVLSNELTIKAQTIVLTKPEGWFEEADRLFVKAMYIFENFNTTFNYAYFLAAHNQIKKAVNIYCKTLNYVSTDDEQALILNNLGLLQRDKNEFGEAEKSYKEALRLRRKLGQINPQYYLNEVGMTLVNLGLLQSDKNEFSKAEKSYKEALEIYEKLAQDNPQTYLPEQARTLNNLGILQRKKNELSESEKSYKKALELLDKLAQDDPQTYVSDQARTLNNFGVLQWEKNEFSKAEKSYKEALDIYRCLAQVNPKTYLPDLGMTLINLGILQRDENEFLEAEKFYKEALEIFGRLAEFYPKTYLPHLAITLNNFGVLQRDKREFKEAEKSYKKALKIRTKLAQANPQIYLPDVAKTSRNLGIVKYNVNEYEEAEKLFKEAFEIYKKLAQANPETYLPDLGMALTNLGNLQGDNNEFGESEKSHKEALEIYLKLAEVNPKTYSIHYATSAVSLAILYRYHLFNRRKSIHYANEAKERFTPFVETVPFAAKWLKVSVEILEYWEKN